MYNRREFLRTVGAGGTALAADGIDGLLSFASAETPNISRQFVDKVNLELQSSDLVKSVIESSKKEGILDKPKEFELQSGMEPNYTAFITYKVDGSTDFPYVSTEEPLALEITTNIGELSERETEIQLTRDILSLIGDRNILRNIVTLRLYDTNFDGKIDMFQAYFEPLFHEGKMEARKSKKRTVKDLSPSMREKLQANFDKGMAQLISEMYIF